MRKSGYRWVTGYLDRHRKPRWRFRRKGYPPHTFREPHGSKAFEREYARCLEADPAPIAVSRTKPGSVGDVIARYYADNAFQDLAGSTQSVYRGVLERFRAAFGDVPMRDFDAERIAALMNAMRHKPAAAARLRKLFAQLFEAGPSRVRSGSRHPRAQVGQPGLSPLDRGRAGAVRSETPAWHQAPARLRTAALRGATQR